MDNTNTTRVYRWCVRRQQRIAREVCEQRVRVPRSRTCKECEKKGGKER